MISSKIPGASSVALWLLMAASTGAAPAPQATPVAFEPVFLKQGELGGEIGRRVELTIEKNFMALDLERDFVAPFRNRRAPEELVKRFGDNAVELGENLHAAVLFARYSTDPKVRERKEWMVREVIATQSPDGYIGVFLAELDGRQMFRNYSLEDASHVVLALTEDYRWFHNEAALASAKKLADYLMNAARHRPVGIKFSSLGESHAFLELYRATGEKPYLAFAAHEPGGALFVDPAGLSDWQQEFFTTRALDYEGTRKLTRALPKGLYPEFASYTYPTERVHLYSLVERALGQLQLQEFEPSPRLWQMSARIFDGLTDAHRPVMAITGAAGWHEGWNDDQDGRGPLGETCASVNLVWFFDAWLRLRGDLRFGDLMERGIYNTLFAAQDPAGRDLRYFTAFSGERRYFELDTYCCPGNFRRGLGSLSSLAYYRTADGVAVNLYTPSTATVQLAGGRTVKLEQQTDYPNSGQIDVLVSPSQPGRFSLRLRIPQWCEHPVISVNGASVGAPAPGVTDFAIEREWRSGDRVQLSLPMTWRWVKGLGMQTDRVALMRGPLVYGLSAQKNPALEGVVLRDLTLDPRSVQDVARDTSVRPDGTSVKARAWKPGSNLAGATDVEVMLTEFPDPSVAEIYFRAPKSFKGVNDELLQKSGTIVPATLKFPNEEQITP